MKPFELLIEDELIRHKTPYQSNFDRQRNQVSKITFGDDKMDSLPDEFHNKNELLEKINIARELLYNSLDRIGRDLSYHFSEKPILHDGWSIKDTIVHLTEWELAMVRCLNTSLRGETPNQPPFGLLEEEVTQINADYYQQNKNKPIGQVLDEAQDSYQLILDAMQRVSENDLFDPRRFDWLQGKPFWPIVAANTCWHYEEHRGTIEKALSVENLE